MNDKTQLSWETFLKPETLRFNLIAASIYIATFEILKDSIVERIKDFFTNGFDQDGLRVDPEYQSEVLSKNCSPVYASLKWLKDMKAIDEADTAAFDRVKEPRNKLAHALTSVLLHEGLPPDFAERFNEVISLLDKIESWWIVNVDIATDPDLHGKEIDETMVIPGPIMGLRLLLDIALGTEEESKKYLDEFMKQKRRKSV
jgi:hypothetical protein